jgi:hypothetical protein
VHNGLLTSVRPSPLPPPVTLLLALHLPPLSAYDTPDTLTTDLLRDLPRSSSDPARALHLRKIRPDVLRIQPQADEVPRLGWRGQGALRRARDVALGHVRPAGRGEQAHRGVFEGGVGVNHIVELEEAGVGQYRYMYDTHEKSKEIREGRNVFATYYVSAHL